MNILLLTHSYPNFTNPLKATFIREQAKVLSLFFNVTVAWFKVDYSHFSLFPGYSFSKEVSENLTEYKVTIKKTLPGITQLKYLANAYRFINKEILSNNKPDIIHSHFSYPAGFLGTIIQKRKKIPNILTEHTRIGAFSRSWYHKQCLNYTLRNTSCIISVSNSLKAEIEKVCFRPIIVIPNIADVDKFKLSETKPGDKLNIGFLGGFESKNKGMDLLLKSASLLDKNSFILHIGGDASVIDAFKNMAKGFGIEANCKFYGEISRNEIADFYSNLDIFVLASQYETFGIVLIEAMSCGVPVIATKCGGPQDIVTPETGMLIEKNSPEELAKAIKNMSQNLEKYNRKAIRNYAEEKFGKSAFIERISKVYLEVLNQH